MARRRRRHAGRDSNGLVRLDRRRPAGSGLRAARRQEWQDHSGPPAVRREAAFLRSHSNPMVQPSTIIPVSLAEARWLREASTQRVFAAIDGGGFQARAVGGAVRNSLLGLPVTDIDIATTARPEDAMRLARAGGLAVIETGLKHGTVTVIADHRPFEVTTLRRDVETHGRHATVAFTDSWSEDACRRDFTINALYCDADGTVHDPL